LRNVSVPSEKEESVRRYVRLLTELHKELRRSMTRVSFFMLQLGKSFDRDNWTKGHRKWLESVELEKLDREVLNERILMLDVLGQRIDEMTNRCESLVEEVGGKAIVERLMCLKGFHFISAVTIWSELWDATRFSDPRKLMGYWGFDCIESSSGEHEHRGHITKQGNVRCRYVLIEAAGAYARSVGHAKAAWKGQPELVVAYCRRAEARLKKRYWHLVHKTGSILKAKVAVARELVGFVWGIMQPEIPV
jgi:transposase